jgi:hypothetical protein
MSKSTWAANWQNVFVSSFAGGTGTQSDPYRIATAMELAYLAQQVNNGNKFRGYYFELENDIDLGEGGREWTRIGSNRTDANKSYFSFDGQFDGKGRTVSNLTINATIGYQGFFGFLGSNAVITDLHLTNINIDGLQQVIGGLAAYNAGRILNCSVTGNVSGSKHLGGLVGYNTGYISGCLENGNVLVKSNNSDGGNIGGLVGYNTGDILHSIAKGNVNYTGRSFACMGGLVGYNKGQVSDCATYGSVNGGNSTGGLVGVNGNEKGTAGTGRLTNCTTSGSISGVDNVGGLVGRSNGGLISNNVTNGNIKGTQYVGGLIGFNSDSIVLNCVANGNVSSTRHVAGGLIGANDGKLIQNSIANGNVSGGSSNSVGGLIGSNGFGMYSDVTIANCIATGNVNGGGDIGGLIGGNGSQHSKVLNCISAGKVNGSQNNTGGLIARNGGTVSICMATGSVKGRDNTGGLIGYNNAGGNVSNSMASGNVTGSNYVGGLIGYNHNKATISNSVYDIQGTGLPEGIGGGKWVKVSGEGTIKITNGNNPGFSNVDDWAFTPGYYPRPSVWVKHSDSMIKGALALAAVPVFLNNNMSAEVNTPFKIPRKTALGNDIKL